MKIFSYLNMDAHYHLFEVEKGKLKEAVTGLKTIGATGVNITIPYKCEVVKYLDELSLEAKNIGAINTIKFINGSAIGYNTDYFGFKMLLDKFSINTEGKRAVILGSGGAAASVLHYLKDSKAKEIFVISRRLDESKLKYKSKDVIICNYGDLEHIKNIDLLINCTPCGMYPDMDISPVPNNVLNNSGIAVDLIYNPKETLFLRQANSLGLKTANGPYMLVGQAVYAQQIWNDINLSQDIIDKIYNSL